MAALTEYDDTVRAKACLRADPLAPTLPPRGLATVFWSRRALLRACTATVCAVLWALPLAGMWVIYLSHASSARVAYHVRVGNCDVSFLASRGHELCTITTWNRDDDYSSPLIFPKSDLSIRAHRGRLSVQSGPWSASSDTADMRVAASGLSFTRSVYSSPSGHDGWVHNSWVIVSVNLWLVVVPSLLMAILLCRYTCVPAWRRACRARRGLCRECGYSLRGNVSGRCPECGTQCLLMTVH